MRSTPPPLFDLCGVIHCHSTHSDGMETIETIARAANRVGLAFLIMTDHDTLAPLQEVGEQWFGNTLLLLGCEITPRHNHLLAYGIREPVSPFLTPTEFTDAVAEQGGIAFLAHPYEAGSRFLGQNRYSWEDWTVTRYTGIEVWNYFSQWISSCRDLPSTLRQLVNWKRGITVPDPEALSRWDRIGLHRRVTGIGGVDAHGIKKRILFWDLVIHPYLRSFRAVRTHLLLDQPFTRDLQTDRSSVMEALREGSCYFANHEEGDPTGFAFVARLDGRWLRMGQEAALERPGSAWFSVRVPYDHHSKPTLRLLKDGQAIAETVDCDLQAADRGPGVYRVEVHRNGRGWIYSNPIYLRGEPGEHQASDD